MVREPRALVLGASGYTGRHLVRELCAREAATIAHLRPDSPRRAALEPAFRALGAELDATPWESAAFAARLSVLDPTHVFFLVGSSRRSRGRGEDRRASYARVDLALARVAIAAAAPLGPRFVYLSSLGAGRPGRSAYLRTRNTVERELAASGLPFTIARPALICGPDREDASRAARAAARAADLLLRAAGPLIGARRRERWRPTGGAELAAGLVRAAFAHTTIGRALEQEELRYHTAVHREFHEPRSRRDRGRH